MLFSLDRDYESTSIDHLEETDYTKLNIKERKHLQDWIIKEPKLLGEDLLIISEELNPVQSIDDRIDLLAIDKDGSLVVIELKRGQADRTTDLQAIKYASYCGATMTAEDAQKYYRDFWNGQDEEYKRKHEQNHGFEQVDKMTGEDVGVRFSQFMDETITTSEDGWASFEVDDRPRIMLAAGDFGKEVTTPIMWLIEEYGMDITCTIIRPYEHQGKVLMSSQQVIPVSEAEEYMTKKRKKEKKQQKKSKSDRTISRLLRDELIREGDTVLFCEHKIPESSEISYDPSDEFWKAEITGKTGRSNNVRWLHNNEEYSFTGLTRAVFNELDDKNRTSFQGYKYWTLPNHRCRDLTELTGND